MKTIQLFKFVFILFFLSIKFGFAQTPKWIIGSGQQDTLGNWTSYTNNNLRFYEVDMRGATPVASKRTIGNSIKSIWTYGTSDPSATICDKNGDVLFYVFCASKTAANGNFQTAPADTMYIVEYNSTTNADEVVAQFPTVKFGASVLEMEAVRKGCTDEYYIIYKTDAATYYSDDIRYVVYNHATKTVSSATVISNNVLHGEGMAISKKINGSQNRYLFYTVFDTSNFTVQIYESLITPSGINPTTLAATTPAYPSTSYPSINPCCVQLSPDGKTLAVTVANGNGFTYSVLLFDVNLSTGVVNNFRYIYDPYSFIIYAAFSSNSQNLFLFQSGSSLQIFYLPVPTSSMSLATTPALPISSYTHWGAAHMQRGYDGNIYVNPGFGTQTLIRIINPNSTPSISAINSHLYGANEWAGSDLPDNVDGDSTVLKSNFSLGKDSTFCGSFSYQIKTHNINTVWSTGAVDSQITVTSAGTYSAYLINNCDTLTDTVVITQLPSQNFNLGNDTTYCSSFSRTLTAGNFSNAHWSTGVISNQITVTTAGTYWAKVSNACGSFTDTIHLYSTSFPNFNLGNDTSYCSNFNRTLTAGNYTNAVWSTGAISNQITVTTAGTYWAKVINACGSFTDTIHLAQHAPPVFSLGDDTSICNGNNVILHPTVSLPATFQWSTGSNLSSIVIFTTGTYWLKITKNGCTTADTMQLTVQNLLAPFSLGNDTTICANQSLTLQAATYTAHWSTGANANSIQIHTAGTYWASDSNACNKVSDTIHVKVLALPTVNIGHDTVFCHPFTKVLKSDSANTIWSTGAVGKQITVNQAGTYWAKVVIQCGIAVDTIHIAQAAYPYFNLGNDTTVCINSPVSLGVNAAQFPSSAFTWQDNSSSATYTAYQGGLYYLTITNMCGTHRDSIMINTFKNACEVALPNAFSPNDDGFNDIYKPISACEVDDYLIRIYNRWGEKVFESTHINIGWDGKYTGTADPISVFVYYLTYKDFCSGKDIFLKGNITLLK
jgi:gliding motility-associated-like protein